MYQTTTERPRRLREQARGVDNLKAQADMDNPNAHSLLSSLDRLADLMLTDADRLREFAGRMRVKMDGGETFEGTPLDSNVLDLVMRTLNNASLLAPAQTAVYSAARLVEG